MTEIVINNKTLCAVIYKSKNQFIAAEKYSSMGFKTFEGAIHWIWAVCRGESFDKSNDLYKMMRPEVKMEVKKQLKEIL